MVISDTTGDLRFADELGIPTIGAGWGLHGVEALRRLTLKHSLSTLERPEEMLPALKKQGLGTEEHADSWQAGQPP